MTWTQAPGGRFPDEAAGPPARPGSGTIDVAPAGGVPARTSGPGPGSGRRRRLEDIQRERREFMRRYGDWLHDQATRTILSVHELHDVTRMIGGLDEGMLGRPRETGDPVGDLSDLLGRSDAWLHLADRYLLDNRDGIGPARVADAARQARELLGRARTLGRTLTGERDAGEGEEGGTCPPRLTRP